MRGGRVSGIVALATALSLTLAAGARAGTITVANTNDSGPGSLRAAIFAAAPGETIVVPAGEYTLTSGELQIAKSVTIEGSGSPTTILRSGGSFRVLAVIGKTNAVTISGVTVRDGSPTVPGGSTGGGGIVNEAALTLEGVVVAHNHADADGGSGQPGGIAEGGGIFSTGELRLANVQVTENLASAVGATGKHGGTARGGGVLAERVEIDHATFTSNRADARGGQGPPSLEQGGGAATGGGLVATASEPPALMLHAVLFAGNAADASAGPGEGAGGSALSGAAELDTAGSGAMALSALTVNGNSALAAGGSSTAAGGFALGGGLFLSHGGTGSASLIDATIAQNSARAPGVGGSGEAGGVFARGFKVPVAIAGTTLNANAVEASGAGTGAGNLASFVLVTVSDTIIAAGTGPAGRENCTGVRESLGYNLDSRDQCAFHATGDKVNTDPLLGPLQENGGGLATERPTPGSPGSPAIDGGPVSGCPAVDERGTPRPQGAACDIGAFEIAVPVLITVAPTEVTEHSAVLRGVAGNPYPLQAGLFFQFGQRPGNFTARIDLGRIGAPAAGTPFSVVVASLKPGTAYHYRLASESPEGGAFGNEINFETPSAGPPSAPRPVLTRLALSPSRLRAERGRGASIAASRRRGATLSYRDSIAAVTTFTVQSVKPGFKVGRSCLSSRPRRAHGRVRRCTRLVKVGSLTHQDAGGAVRLRFTGRVNGRPLSPGSYRLSAVARSAAGKSSSAQAIGFKVIP